MCPPKTVTNCQMHRLGQSWKPPENSGSPSRDASINRQIQKNEACWPPPRIQDLLQNLHLRDFLAMFAPIPPVPLPRTWSIPIPAQLADSDSEAYQAQRVQGLLEHPDLPNLFREAVRVWKALPPKGNK